MPAPPVTTVGRPFHGRRVRGPQPLRRLSTRIRADSSRTSVLLATLKRRPCGCCERVGLPATLPASPCISAVTIVESFLSGGLDMRRNMLLGVLLASGALSMAVTAYQPPAQPPGPRVINIEKL